MQQIRKLDESEMHGIYTRLFPEAFPQAEIRSWKSIRLYAQAGRYEAWGLYEDGELYSYAFLFRRDNVLLLDYLATVPAARGKGLGGGFLRQLQQQLAPAVLLGEVEAPDGGSHDELRLRRMHFYARHGFALEPVKARVYGVTFRIISYARPAGMTADGVSAALRAIYEELLGKWRVRLHVRIWQEEPEF